MISARLPLIADTAQWPSQTLTETDIHSACQHISVAGERFLAHHQLPRRYLELFPRLLVPLAAHLRHFTEQQRSPLVVGIAGCQGAGKTTLTQALQLVFQYVFGLSCCHLSLDDYYWPQAYRHQLAKDIHPLLATRGVPGTHDTALLGNTLRALLHADEGSETIMPLFDKGIDDRRPETQWGRFIGRPDIVLLEGWCVGAHAEANDALEEPINPLELDEDPQGAWRRWVNRQLAERYEPLFSTLNRLIFMQAPNWDVVMEWRRLQEAKLMRAQGANYRGGLDNPQQLMRFINHYERITRHMLRTLPSTADILLAQDTEQRIAHISLKHE
ncbi:hypothetical protein [Mangrovitalea sediminis]|uniref:hypothetical protein n=1 Tax=Mangrovitalea sediminis TaxID=1982043 RepID=UPI000BE54C57|nr:hypothetical protein [Mangrovitalea sediminis]